MRAKNEKAGLFSIAHADSRPPNGKPPIDWSVIDAAKTDRTARFAVSLLVRGNKREKGDFRATLVRIPNAGRTERGHCPGSVVILGENPRCPEEFP
jgi:hypothetical protein